MTGYIPQKTSQQAILPLTFNKILGSYVKTVGPADYTVKACLRVANKKISKSNQLLTFKKKNKTQVLLTVFSNNSKRTKKSMGKLNLLKIRPQLLNGVVYEVQNKNYGKIEGKENRVRVLDGYKGNTHMRVGNTLINTGLYTNEKTLQTNKSKILRKLAEAKESPALGFIFNTLTM